MRFKKYLIICFIETKKNLFNFQQVYFKIKITLVNRDAKFVQKIKHNMT